MSKTNTMNSGQQLHLVKILEDLLKLPENKECVDCGTKAPRWASTNLGVFMCIRCSGIHRSLGVHISKVKSVSLDKWTPEQVEFMQQMGNAKGNEIYEAYVPASYNKGDIRVENIALEQWIRDKYERKRFMRRDGAEPVTRREYRESGNGNYDRDRRDRDDRDRRDRDHRDDRERRDRDRDHREEREQPRREQPRESTSKPQQAPIRTPASVKVPLPAPKVAAPEPSYDLLDWNEPAKVPPAAPAQQEDLFGDFNSGTPANSGLDKNAILSLYNTPQVPTIGPHSGSAYPPPGGYYPGGMHAGMQQQQHIGYRPPNYNITMGPPQVQMGSMHGQYMHNMPGGYNGMQHYPGGQQMGMGGSQMGMGGAPHMGMGGGAHVTMGSVPPNFFNQPPQNQFASRPANGANYNLNGFNL